MSPRTKNMIIYSVMAVVITLFIYAIFVGNHVKQEEEEKAEEPEAGLAGGKSQSQAIRQYEADDEYTQENKNKETNKDPIVEQHGSLDIEMPKAETLENSESKYADHFLKEDIEKSRKTASRFVKNLYAFNGDEAMEHVKSTKPLSTADLYQALMEQTPRPTAATYKKEAASLNVYEPYDPGQEQLIWNVQVKGHVYDKNGDKTAVERQVYTIKTTKVEGVFKVKNYTLNAPF